MHFLHWHKGRHRRRIKSYTTLEKCYIIQALRISATKTKTPNLTRLYPKAGAIIC
jgi:hypothetical protein